MRFGGTYDDENVFNCTNMAFYVSPGVGVSYPIGILTGSILVTLDGEFYSSSVPVTFSVAAVNEKGWRVGVQPISFKIPENSILRAEINWQF